MRSSRQGTLFLSAQRLKAFAQKHNAPFYLYSEAGIRQTFTALCDSMAAFTGYAQYFPLSLNPNPTLLRLLRELGCGVVCENGAQLRLAADCGFSGTQILYAPMIFFPEEEALAHTLGCTFVLESADALPQRPPARVLLSLRPQTRLRTDDGSSIQFDALKTGMPLEELLSLAQRLSLWGTQSVGLILRGCQNDLRPSYYPLIARTLCAAAVQLFQKTGIAADCINLADGFGISYRPGEPEPDIALCAAALAQIREELLCPAGLEHTRFETALGRFLLAHHGVFLTQVAAVRQYQRPLLITQAAAQQLADMGTLGTYHHITVLGKDVTQNGILCDVAGCQADLRRLFAARCLLPAVQSGDWLVFHDTGANCAVLSAPSAGYPPCAEFLLTQDGQLEQI